MILYSNNTEPITQEMNLLLELFLFINAAHLIWTVNESQFEKIRPTFDEIYGKGWDENVHEKIKVETSPLNSEENALNEQADHDDNIDQDDEAYNSDSTDQNLTQKDPDLTDQNFIQQDPDSTDQNLTQQNPDSTDQNLTQQDPDSTDQNLTQQDPDSTDQNVTQKDPDRIDQGDDDEGINDEFSEKEKRGIICKFHAMRKEYKQKGKYSTAERVKIECKIGNKLGVNREKIYQLKKEFGLNKTNFYEKKKREFITKIEEIKTSQQVEQNKFAKNLGISRVTFCRWKKEFELSIDSQIIYSKNEKLELLEKYYKIKQRNPKLNVIDIAKRLNISSVTLHKWKKPFDLILNKNSVDEHSLPENRPSFADNDTFGHPMPSSDENLWAWNLAKKKRTERIEVEYSVENSGGSDYEKSNDFEEKSDALSNEEQQKSEKKIIKKIRSDNEKKKILNKFLAKKERLANEFGSTPKSKLEEIARELGTCFRTIRNWRFKFGMGYKNSKCQSKRNDQREKIFKKFDKMKEKRIGKNKFAKRTEIEEEIARELGVSKPTINNWKVKFGKNNFKHYSREEKLKIIKQFEKVKNENKGKTIKGSSYDKEQKIAKELGTSRSAIWRWKQEFGISKFHCFTESERLKLIKKYFKMMKQNPHLSRDDIAAKLNLSRRTFSRWISELKNKISENNTDSDSTDEDVLTFV